MRSNYICRIRRGNSLIVLTNCKGVLIMKGYVSNIQRFSVNDGYGIRTIVFLLGCTLRCRWCQNPETLELKPNLMFLEDLCKGCNQCKRVCTYGCPKVINNGHLILDKSKCNNCFECVESCPYNALKVTGIEMTSEQVLKEVMRDKVFYKLQYL